MFWLTLSQQGSKMLLCPLLQTSRCLSNLSHAVKDEEDFQVGNNVPMRDSKDVDNQIDPLHKQWHKSLVISRTRRSESPEIIPYVIAITSSPPPNLSIRFVQTSNNENQATPWMQAIIVQTFNLHCSWQTFYFNVSERACASNYLNSPNVHNYLSLTCKDGGNTESMKAVLMQASFNRMSSGSALSRTSSLKYKNKCSNT